MSSRYVKLLFALSAAFTLGAVLFHLFQTADVGRMGRDAEVVSTIKIYRTICGPINARLDPIVGRYDFDQRDAGAFRRAVEIRYSRKIEELSSKQSGPPRAACSELLRTIEKNFLAVQER